MKSIVYFNKLKILITDSYIFQQFQILESDFLDILDAEPMKPIDAQIRLGKTPKTWANYEKYPAQCRRHKFLFGKYNIISRDCWDCYKVQINPNSVLELFKLLFLFRTDAFMSSYTMKFFLHPHKHNPNNYSGLFYFQSLTEAEKTLKHIQEIIKTEINPNIPIKVKRGCTEFNNFLPGYADVNLNWDSLVKDKEKWINIELMFDQRNEASNIKPIISDSFPANKYFDYIDFKVMHTWLQFAKSIGDQSYLKVTQSKLGL